jgi:hypothetical protein
MRMQPQSPLVIFATGGSGTRVLARIAQRSGYFMGTSLTRNEDSRDMIAFFKQWVAPYLVESRWVDRILEDKALTDAPPRRMVDAFRSTIERHRSALADTSKRWGWKGPRGMFVLPFLHQEYPRMMAIHLIRDGRDMAYSENQGQVKMFGSHVLDLPYRALPRPVQSIKLWSRINLAAAHYGERFLAENYMRVRFEDLCSSPASTVAAVLNFIHSDASASARSLATELVQPPTTVNRWQERDPAEVAAVVRAGDQALRRFQYVSDQR